MQRSYDNLWSSVHRSMVARQFCECLMAFLRFVRLSLTWRASILRSLFRRTPAHDTWVCCTIILQLFCSFHVYGFARPPPDKKCEQSFTQFKKATPNFILYAWWSMEIQIKIRMITYICQNWLMEKAQIMQNYWWLGQENGGNIARLTGLKM